LARAADELALDHRQRQTAVLKAGCDRFAGDATAETYDVELLRQDFLRHTPMPASM